VSAAMMAHRGAQLQRDRCAWSFTRSAGWAYDRAGRSKAVAAAHGIHVSGGTRYKQGVSYSPLAKAYAILAENPRTSPFPALTEAWAIVMQSQIVQTPTTALLSRRNELEAMEIDVNRDIAHGRMAGGSLRELRARQADVVLELTAIETELDERKVAR
jgi:hypothetical protein